MKPIFNPTTVQKIVSYDYARGIEKHRVVVRTHDSGTSITVFLLGSKGEKHRVIWQADCLGMDALPAENFTSVNERSL